MRFPTYFKRRHGATPATLPAIGSDSAPVFGTPAQSNADNVLSYRLKPNHPVQRIAIGYWYEGVGSAVTLPVAIWAWDQTSEKWFQAATGTLTNGQLTYLRVSALDEPTQTQANMDKPGHGLDVMIIVSDNTSPDGTLHFVAGPDSAQF